MFDINAAFGLHEVAHQQQRRPEPHMAIPGVHIAPLGTSAGMPKVVVGLYGGVSMVVSGGMGLYRHACMCRIQCWQSARLWLHSGGARPHGSQRHKEVRESEFLRS